MIVALLAPALVSAACPAIGRQILSPFAAEAPVYDVATNAVVDHVKVVKGVVSPILVIVDCPGRYFIAQENGKMVAVARADVSYGEPLESGLICAGDLHGGRSNKELVGNHAADPMLCPKTPVGAAKK